MNTTGIRPAPEAPVVEPGQLDEATRDVLRRAKGLVAKEWGQRSDVENVTRLGRAGPHCALTAIWATDIWAGKAADALVSTLGIANRFGVTVWNDAPERTQADVIALYDAALTGQPYKP
jgi:hypothetical protein